MTQPINMLAAINQLRKLRAREINNNCLLLNSTAKMCLFGSPDATETAVLVEEQRQQDRKRFMKRYTFDVDREIDPQDRENIEPKSEERFGKIRSLKDKKLRMERAFKPYNNQTKMTDFCNITKST